jgi:hypothetical protein
MFVFGNVGVRAPIPDEVALLIKKRNSIGAQPEGFTGFGSNTIFKILEGLLAGKHLKD